MKAYSRVLACVPSVATSSTAMRYKLVDIGRVIQSLVDERDIEWKWLGQP